MLFNIPTGVKSINSILENGSVKSFAQIWFADLDMNEVSQQWRRPQVQPPDASCSYTSCFPTGYRPHGEVGRRPA